MTKINDKIFFLRKHIHNERVYFNNLMICFRHGFEERKILHMFHYFVKEIISFRFIKTNMKCFINQYSFTGF